jgi:NAD(P)-dependent dehydrogenase (short-subunit alcohol dehydrogenase family)
MKDNLFNLKGRVIVVTGAAGLLGRQHADAIAFAGGIPVLLDLTLESVEQLAQEIHTKYGCNAVGYAVDITKESQVENNVSEILNKFAKIDALVNNAANNPKVENKDGKNFSRLENFPIDAWDADIAVGLTGAFLCLKHYGTAISQNPAGGVILNISSDLGLIAPDQRLYRQPGLLEEQQPVKPVTYSVVKTGLIGLTRYLATYWPDRVRCNALCPGGVEAGQPDNFIKEVNARIPLGRLAQADEYQGVLLFLLSDASAYMNGAILPIEGGRSVW